MRLDLKPRTLRDTDRLLERVAPLPVEVPVVDLDQRDAGLTVGQDRREGEILAEPVHVSNCTSDRMSWLSRRAIILAPGLVDALTS